MSALKGGRGVVLGEKRFSWKFLRAKPVERCQRVRRSAVKLLTGDLQAAACELRLF